MSFTRLAVGEQYTGKIPMKDGCFFDMTNSGTYLKLFFNGMTPQEVQDICLGERRFALTVRNGIIFILFKFGRQPWMDAPYSVHLSPNLTALSELSAWLGYSLTITSVDISNGNVMSSNFLGLPRRFSQVLRQEIIKQTREPFNALEYNKTIRNIYAAYSTKDLLKQASVKQRLYRSNEKMSMTADKVIGQKAQFGIRKSLQDIASKVKNIPYSGMLPGELKPFHAYIMDGGHIIMCVPKRFKYAVNPMEPFEYEVPVPVKHVLAHDYEIIGDCVVVDVEYNDNVGVLFDCDCEEYEPYSVSMNPTI